MIDPFLYEAVEFATTGLVSPGLPYLVEPVYGSLDLDAYSDVGRGHFASLQQGNLRP